ncbi:MAG: hypothetical protein EHM23_30090 [Acidobacteria bacterium]|nr:MAG: hypothetical protein EHM23_30090 [Acidobacteriota bacterium]
MSCVLRVSAINIQEVLQSTRLRPYRVGADTAHFEVSDAKVGDFEQEIRDATGYLRSNETQLRKMFSSFENIEGTLDFSVAWRDVAVQVDVLPPELLRLAGELGLAIALSHYPLSEQDETSNNSSVVLLKYVDYYLARGLPV